MRSMFQVVKNTQTMMIVQKGATKEVVESHEDKKVECDRMGLNYTELIGN